MDITIVWFELVCLLGWSTGIGAHTDRETTQTPPLNHKFLINAHLRAHPTHAQ